MNSVVQIPDLDTESNDNLSDSYIKVDDQDVAIQGWEEIDHIELLDRYSQTKRPPWKSLPSARHIRVLKLFPPRHEPSSSQLDLIRCTFDVVDLDAAKAKYEALSYAWGPMNQGQELIVCNGVRVLIQRNLYQALENLRKGMASTQIRRIWVDALCIDQFNPTERGQQVSMMKDIFAFASRVLIWLGQSDRASREVMTATRFLRDLSFMNMTAVKAMLKYSLSDKRMREDFIDRTWFQRVWTLQEAVRATRATMICGEDEVEWSDFRDVWNLRYENYKAHRKLGSEDIWNINESVSFVGLINSFDIQSRYQSHDIEATSATNKLPLSEILIRSWYRDATEHRDRVFAILGLLEEDKYPDLRPDYSIPKSELFLNVTKMAMAIDRTPALLHLAGLSPTISTSTFELDPPADSASTSEPITRPSWVPDWTIRGRQNTWLRSLLASSDSAARIDSSSSGLYRNNQWMPEFEGDTLKLRGCVLGQVHRNPRTHSNEIKCLNPFYYNYILRESQSPDGRSQTYTVQDCPYDGATLEDDDLLCVFAHCMSLFLIRPLNQFDFSTEYDFEWFKEDYASRSIPFPCQLVGPCTAPGFQLEGNASDAPDSFVLH